MPCALTHTCLQKRLAESALLHQQPMPGLCQEAAAFARKLPFVSDGCLCDCPRPRSKEKVGQGIMAQQAQQALVLLLQAV
jgi:hypothetical protein